MKTYLFVTKTHHDVFAETLEGALKAFNEMKRRGLSPQFDTVIPVRVEEEEGYYTPVDHPLRAGDPDASKDAQLH